MEKESNLPGPKAAKRSPEESSLSGLQTLGKPFQKKNRENYEWLLHQVEQIVAVRLFLYAFGEYSDCNFKMSYLFLKQHFFFFLRVKQRFFQQQNTTFLLCF